MQFSDCVGIGRDLVRLLQDVSKIPEFEQLWKDLIQKPSSFLPNFNGISQLLSTRTPRIYPQCRVTPDIETQLMFLMKNVIKFSIFSRQNQLKI